MFVISAVTKNVPSVYAKVYLFISLLDAVLFWIWRNSPIDIFAWILFTINVGCVANGFLLYKGVKKRSVFRCKVFCAVEGILIFFGILSLAMQHPSTGHILWFIIVVVLRMYGLKLVRKFIRMAQIPEVLAKVTMDVLSEACEERESV